LGLGHSAIQVVSRIARENLYIHAQVAKLALDGLCASDARAAPVPFAMIVMGSTGRGESLLHPDQDNGLILQDYPDELHSEVDKFFIDLTDRINQDLAYVGFPLCTGHVMASNPLWRKGLQQWRAQLGAWLSRPAPTVVRLANIFLDFSWAYGDARLVDDLRSYATRRFAASPGFLRELCHDDIRDPVALGWFGRIQTGWSKTNKDELDLKHFGLMPLTEAIRLLAIKSAIETRFTQDRVKELGALGVLSDDEVARVLRAHAVIVGLILRRQIVQYRSEEPPDGIIKPHQLDKHQHDALVQSLKDVRMLQNRLRLEFSQSMLPM
jgi:CBS domain-containing protein